MTICVATICRWVYGIVAQATCGMNTCAYHCASGCFAEARSVRTETNRETLSAVSAKQFFADHPPSSTELLRRAAETDPEVASLLSVHPRNVDAAIHSSIYPDDKMLIRQMICDSAFHGIPHQIAAAHRTKTKCFGSVPDPRTA